MSEDMTEGFGADLAALIRAYEEEGHSVFRPSAASRWTVCPGSVVAEIQARADRAGYDAAEGTVAHAIAEHRLTNKGKLPTWAKPGKTREERGFIIPISVEMLAYVDDYISWIEELGPADYQAAETRVDFSDLTPIPNQGGTADHTHVRNGVLTITDLKYGTGVRVYAKGNKQLRLYAYGALREIEWMMPIERIVLRICQPRLEIFETWEITVEELRQFAADVREAAHRAWQPRAPRVPDPEACRWCSVSATCPALAAKAQAIADEIFDDLDAVQPETVSVPTVPLEMRARPAELSTEELARILRWRGTFDAWFRDVHDELIARVANGQDAPGWKVVEGRTKRAWIDEDAAVETLRAIGLGEDEIFVKKLVSPKRASDLLRIVKKGDPKKLLKQHIVQPPGPRALVVEEDGRESVESAGDEIFDDLT
jgi:hypothetical protein